MKNTAIVSGVLGSNGQIELGNNSVVSGGIQLGTSSTPPPILGSGSTLGGNPPVTYRSEADGAFVLAPVDMGNTATVNDNDRITSGQDTGSNVTYTNTANAPRALSIGEQRLAHARRRHLQLLQGHARQQRLHHDRRRREDPLLPRLAGPPDAGTAGDCIPDNYTGTASQKAATARSNGYGGMSLGQGSNFNNPGHAINFQIYMYGYTNGTHTVEFNNSQADERGDLRALEQADLEQHGRHHRRGRGEQGRVQELGDVLLGGRRRPVRPVRAADRHGLGLLPDGVDRVPPVRTTTSDPESGC